MTVLRMLGRFLAICSLLFLCNSLSFADSISHRGQEFLVYRVDPKSKKIALFWKDTNGERFGSFRRLREHLASKGQELRFAMNAGIFGVDYAPLGLHIEESQRLCPLNLGKGGRGNFYLKPNGVFFLANQHPAIVDAREFPKLKVKPQLATQSGPLLVRNGTLHPAFREESINRHFRNGVGVTHDGQVVFAMSRGLVTFYEFATLFRDVLGCPNALYLDGTLSAMYAPELGLTFLGGDFAGILAIVNPRTSNLHE